MKGQDIVVLLKLLGREEPWTYLSLAKELGMSASEVHAAVKRCEDTGLYNPHSRRPNGEPLREFLFHGLRYVFPARPGGSVQGIPTSFAAPPLNKKISFDPAEAPVMPLLHGPACGPEIAPLCRSAPFAANNDDRLYCLLSLVDALRTGRARERKMAKEALTELIV